MTRAEFRAANPTYAKLGPSKNKAYYVFKTAFLDYGPRLDDPVVIARTADFGGRSAKVKKAIGQFKADGEFAPLEHYLPSDLAQIPRNRLRVCEAAVQLDFLLGPYSLYSCVDKNEIQKVIADARRKGKLTCVEICAGAGGQAIGLENAGFEHVALVEYESDYCAVLRNNKPNWNVICADVHKFDGSPYVGVDLLAGGVPCPPFSVASKQLGENDERDLFPEAIRLISEIKPRAVMLENVRGLLDPKFDVYRNAILERIRALGYAVQIKLLQACDYGVPQIRPRVVIVGIRSGEHGTFSYPPPEKRRAPSVGESLRDLMGANGWRGLNRWVERANKVAPTIVGGSKKHGGPDLGPTRARRAWAELGVDGLGVANEAPSKDFEGMPKLTKEMIAAIQGFPPSWDFGKKKTLACRMIGNAFPPPVANAVGRCIRKALNND
ncbi:MAG: DNA cytosine methyltransferase [Kiritimatiellae bacterium]|nr:DNA cytosine methyltransferase [Kiritimatiellia bacterium]